MRGPLVSQPLRSVSATASISSSPIAGGWNERKVLRLEESFCIGGSEADELGGAVGARERLVAALAVGEHEPGPVTPSPERPERPAGRAVDTRVEDALGPPRLVQALTSSSTPSGGTRKRTAAPPLGFCSGISSGSPRAAASARPLRSTPSAARQSSAS